MSNFTLSILISLCLLLSSCSTTSVERSPSSKTHEFSAYDSAQDSISHLHGRNKRVVSCGLLFRLWMSRRGWPLYQQLCRPHRWLWILGRPKSSDWCDDDPNLSTAFFKKRRGSKVCGEILQERQGRSPAKIYVLTDTHQYKITYSQGP